MRFAGLQTANGRGSNVSCALDQCRLVGAAIVPKVEGGDFFLNAFLMLPTDALAVLSAEFLFE